MLTRQNPRQGQCRCIALLQEGQRRTQHGSTIKLTYTSHSTNYGHHGEPSVVHMSPWSRSVVVRDKPKSSMQQINRVSFARATAGPPARCCR